MPLMPQKLQTLMLVLLRVLHKLRQGGGYCSDCRAAEAATATPKHAAHTRSSIQTCGSRRKPTERLHCRKSRLLGTYCRTQCPRGSHGCVLMHMQLPAV